MPSFTPFILFHFFVKDFFNYPLLYSVEEALYFGSFIIVVNSFSSNFFHMILLEIV